MKHLFAVFSSLLSGSVEGLPPPPRRAEWTPEARLGRRLLLAALLVVPNVALWVGHRDGKSLRDLRDQGLSASARVLRKSWESGGKGGKRHYVEYAFEAGGRTRSF